MGLVKTVRSVLSLVPFWLKAGQNGDVVSVESLADLAFSCPGVVPMQVRSELLEFASIIREQRPRAFLEIGTRNGGTFFILCRLADPHAIVISLDLPGGRFGGGYTVFQIPVMRRMRRSRQQLGLFRADSHRVETRTRVMHTLNGVQLDLLFIDGDHTYEGVKRDFEMYSPLVKPGGIVAFHDIVEISAAGVEVARFWNEIKTDYRNREIIENRQQGWGGIGILYL